MTDQLVIKASVLCKPPKYVEQGKFCGPLNRSLSGDCFHLFCFLFLVGPWLLSSGRTHMLQDRLLGQDEGKGCASEQPLFG